MDELKLQTELQAKGKPYVLATVVEVLGSASAKTGSKAIISEGKNLWGWVGGGCAESFTISQAEEAIQERQPRIITADLDDEVFGLGMPCGGKMKIFLDPILPAEKVSLPYSKNMESLVNYFGLQLEDARKNSSNESARPVSNLQCLIEIGLEMAKSRGLTETVAELGTLLRKTLETEDAPAASTPSSNHVLILGHSRITEELAKLFHLVEWRVEVYGLELNAENYPAAVLARKAQKEYQGLQFSKDSFVIVASHHKGDHEYIEGALREKAKFVGMVASHKRANLVIEALRNKGVENLEFVQSPVGIPLQCRNPKEIALSIVLECVKRSS